MTSDAAKVSPAHLLGGPPDGVLVPEAHLTGFGGFHGGLALGVLASAMAQAAGPDADRPLRSITGRFLRPLDRPAEVAVETPRTGRTVTTVAATARSDAGDHLTATAVYGTDHEQRWPSFLPQMPIAPPPEDLDVFAIPPEFVPIAAYTEIRPVGTARPYIGGTEAQLVAWIRLAGEDAPPTTEQFVFLADALAPSYAAVLSTLAIVPTVEMTVRPSRNLASASSPWVLLRAVTTEADAGGWCEERIDVWGPDGAFLGSANQLRVVKVLSA